jgi:5-methylphenazine-1-carboxylate 1-monooxygenase
MNKRQRAGPLEAGGPVKPIDALVVGAGIGGLVTALSLHDAGFEVLVVESVDALLPLGTGINLQPHAVRELEELGLIERLIAAAVSPTSLAYFSKHGQRIWAEPRGRTAGYRWPQLSLHRGHLQQVLYQAALDRLGSERVLTGHEATSFVTHADGVVTTFVRRSDNAPIEILAKLLVGADGIHSAVRRQLVPNEGRPRWNGALMWRGVCTATPMLDGRTMVWIGHPHQKVVAYPIADLRDGLQRINVIAELNRPDGYHPDVQEWTRPGSHAEIVPAFESWTFDWLDVPALISSCPELYVYPMVDRNPLERWGEARVTLLGDAAHPMYPIGSNGASQAIIDGRVLTGCLLRHGLVGGAAAYEAVRRPATAEVVLANRQLGPERPMAVVEERAPDGFSNLSDVISEDELTSMSEEYKRLAGFSVSALNDRPSLLSTPW